MINKLKNQGIGFVSVRNALDAKREALEYDAKIFHDDYAKNVLPSYNLAINFLNHGVLPAYNLAIRFLKMIGC